MFYVINNLITGLTVNCGPFRSKTVAEKRLAEARKCSDCVRLVQVDHKL